MVSGCGDLLESANYLRKEPTPETELTVQLTAHNWFWSYSYEEYPDIEETLVFPLTEEAVSYTHLTLPTIA